MGDRTLNFVQRTAFEFCPGERTLNFVQRTAFEFCPGLARFIFSYARAREHQEQASISKTYEQ